MKRTLAEAFVKNPVELVVGLFVLAIGIVMSTQPGWLQPVGAVLAAAGSFLISWIMARSTERARASTELQSQLQSVNTSLGTICGQILEAIRSAECNEVPPEASFALIRQSTTDLLGVVQRIETLTETRIQVETVEALMRLKGLLRSAIASEPAPSVAENLREAQETLDLTLEELAAQTKARKPETVTCPECGAPTTAMLGLLPGSSAKPECAKCGARFHAHRSSDGSTFARKPGARPAAARPPS